MIEQNNDKFNQEGHSSIKQIKHRKKWEIQQTFKYCQFIQNNRQTLEFSQKKLKQRIYNKMAEYIGTRSTHQCRSHHQKVLKRHSTIDQFIKAFKGKTQKAKQGKVGENQQKLNDSIQKNLNQEKNIRKLNLGQFQRGVQSNQNVLTSQKSGPFKSNASFSKKQGTENQIKPEINFNPTQLGSIPINKAPVGHPNFHPYNQNENLKIPNFVQLGLNKNLQNPKTSLKANQKMRKNIIVQPNKINVETYGQKEGNEKKTFHHNIQKCNMINENSNEKWEIKSQNVVQNQKGDKNQQGIQKQNNFQNAGFLKNSPIIGSLPPYIALSNTLKFLMSHSNWICESILKNQNLNIINPLIQQNLLQLTEKKIQIFGNQDEYYRIWIEYVKAEQQNSSMESMEQSESQAVSEPTDDDLRRRIRRIFNQTLIEYGLMLNCYPEEFVSDEVNFYLPEQDKIFMPRHPNNTEMHEQTPPWQRGFTPLSPNNRFRECLSALKVHQSEYTNLLERIRQNKIAQQMKSETVKKEDCEIQSSLKQIILQSHPEQVLKDRKDQKKGGDLAQTRDSQEQEQEKPVFGFQTKKPNNDLVPTRDSDSSESNYLNREKMNGQKYQILNINLQQYNQSRLFEGRNNQIGSTFTIFSNRGETEIKNMESDISEKVNSK